MHDLADAIAAAHAALDERFYPGPTEEMVAAAIEAAAPVIAAKAWDEGFHQGGPMHDVDYDDPTAHTRNPYRADQQRRADQ